MEDEKFITSSISIPKFKDNWTVTCKFKKVSTKRTCIFSHANKKSESEQLIMGNFICCIRAEKTKSYYPVLRDRCFCYQFILSIIQLNYSTCFSLKQIISRFFLYRITLHQGSVM